MTREHAAALMRSGRIRYLAYSAGVVGLLMVPGLLLSKVLYAGHPQLLGHLVIAAALLLPPAAMALITIPRLHDMGRGGAWALVPLIAYVCLLLTVRFAANWSAVQAHSLSFLSLLYSFFLPLLYNGALFSPFAVLPGDRGGNRFGPPPPADSRNMRVAAGITVFLYAVCVAVPGSAYLYHRHQEQLSVDDALARALSVEAPLRDYFLAHNAWPDNLVLAYPDRRYAGLSSWGYRSKALVVDAPIRYDDGVARYYPGGVDLVGVAVWSTDGGETWHCGPVGKLPGTLPESCRESGMPAYDGPT